MVISGYVSTVFVSGWCLSLDVPGQCLSPDVSGRCLSVDESGQCLCPVMSSRWLTFNSKYMVHAMSAQHQVDCL